jgi:hypothetical protein
MWRAGMNSKGMNSRGVNGKGMDDRGMFTAEHRSLPTIRAYVISLLPGFGFPLTFALFVPFVDGYDLRASTI